MALYAIAFDLDTVSMRNDGLTKSQRTRIYQKEIPEALAECGFNAHPQGSLYHTVGEQNPIHAIMQLQATMKGKAMQFCKYVKRVHVFRMEEWSDVTTLLSNKPEAGPPAPAEELDQQEEFDEVADQLEPAEAEPVAAADGRGK